MVKINPLKYHEPLTYEEPMQLNMSKEIKTLLLSYNLCESAISCHNIFKEHISQSLFHTAVITYYSVCKSKTEKEWILNLLQNPEKIKFLYLRRNLMIPHNSSLHERIKQIFEKYEKIRDKNIAHKDKKGIQEHGTTWLKIPQGIGGGDIIQNATPFIFESAFVSIPLNEQNEFLTLIEVTLDLWWRKDNLPVDQKNPDGTYSKIPQPNPIN